MQVAAWWAIGAALLVSLMSPIVLRPVLHRHGIVDRPNERSSHVNPTLRAGGIAPLAGFLLGCGLLVAVLDGQSRAVVWIVALGALLAGLLGLTEDVRGLSVLVRAAGLLVVGLVVGILLGAVFSASWWQGAVGALALLVYVNITNFMDGIDGISGLHGLIGGGAYALFGVLSHTPWLALSGMVVGAAFAAFLPWNLRTPGIFLGDVGSYLLGASLAGMGVAAWFAGFSPVVVLAPCAIYLADTFSTLARRVAREEPILRSHRTHIYQRLTDTGLGHVQVATIVSLLSLSTSTLGAMALRGWLSSWLALLLIVGVCGLYIAMPRLRGNRLAPRTANALKPFELPGPIQSRPDFAPKRWIVLGASGFVGSALVTHLSSLGHDVQKLPAPRLTLDPASDHGEAIAASAVQHAALDALISALQGVDVVVNSAGMATPDAPPSDQLYGANALLPALVCHAAGVAGVQRTIHLSSAAVQGHRPVLDETADALPFSPYSRSKALGERAFLAAGRARPGSDAIVIRATSVQGRGRRTTASLKRISGSHLASVAGTGDQPTVVSSIDGLVDFITQVSLSTGTVGPIMLQPWEGYTVSEVLRAAGGSEPRHLPSWSCRAVLLCMRQLGKVIPEIAGAGRRLEMMWMGQQQVSTYEAVFPAVPRGHLKAILSEPDAVA